MALYIIKNISWEGICTYLTVAKPTGALSDWSTHKSKAHRFQHDQPTLAEVLSEHYTGQTYSGDERLLS